MAPPYHPPARIFFGLYLIVFVRWRRERTENTVVWSKKQKQWHILITSSLSTRPVLFREPETVWSERASTHMHTHRWASSWGIVRKRKKKEKPPAQSHMLPPALKCQRLWSNKTGPGVTTGGRPASKRAGIYKSCLIPLCLLLWRLPAFYHPHQWECRLFYREPLHLTRLTKESVKTQWLFWPSRGSWIYIITLYYFMTKRFAKITHLFLISTILDVYYLYIQHGTQCVF